MARFQPKSGRGSIGEWPHLHALSGGDLCARLQAQQGTRLTEAEEGVAHLQPAHMEDTVAQRAAQVVRAVAVVVEFLAADGRQLDGRLVAQAEQALQGGADEELEGDEGRDRVAGQAEEGDAATLALLAGEEEGFAGFDAHPPEFRGHAEGAQGRLDVVMIADRDTAADEDDLAFRGEPVEGGDGGVEVVRAVHGGCVTQAGAAQEGLEHDGVAVVDLAGGEGFAGRAQFVAGAQDGGARRQVHGHAGQALGGQQAELGGRQAVAGLEQELAGTEFGAGAADVFTRLHRLAAEQALGAGLGILLHEHGIGAGGQGGAGENPHGLARAAVQAEVEAGRLAAGEGQAAAGGTVGGAQGVTVDHRVVEAGQWHGGGEPACGTEAGGLDQGQLDHRSGLDGGEHALQGFVFGNHEPEGGGVGR